MSWILMFLTPTIWSTSKSRSSKMKATRPCSFFSDMGHLSEVAARVCDRALDGRGRNGRGVTEVDFRIRAPHAAAHVQCARRDRALVGRHGGDPPEAVVAGRRGYEGARF